MALFGQSPTNYYRPNNNGDWGREYARLVAEEKRALEAAQAAADKTNEQQLQRIYEDVSRKAQEKKVQNQVNIQAKLSSLNTPVYTLGFNKSYNRDSIGADSIRINPSDSIRINPVDSLRVNPSDSLRVNPSDSIGADSLRVIPADSLRVSPADSTAYEIDSTPIQSIINPTQ